MEWTSFRVQICFKADPVFLNGRCGIGSGNDTVQRSRTDVFNMKSVSYGFIRCEILHLAEIKLYTQRTQSQKNRILDIPIYSNTSKVGSQVTMQAIRELGWKKGTWKLGDGAFLATDLMVFSLHKFIP